MSAPTPADGTGEPQAVSGDAENGGRTVHQFLKDVGLFFAAPFITLAYLLLFPFIGLRLLLRSGRRPSRGRQCGAELTARRRRRHSRQGRWRSFAVQRRKVRDVDAYPV